MNMKIFTVSHKSAGFKPSKLGVVQTDLSEKAANALHNHRTAAISSHDRHIRRPVVGAGLHYH